MACGCVLRPGQAAEAAAHGRRSEPDVSRPDSANVELPRVLETPRCRGCGTPRLGSDARGFPGWWLCGGEQKSVAVHREAILGEAKQKRKTRGQPGEVGRGMAAVIAVDVFGIRWRMVVRVDRDDGRQVANVLGGPCRRDAEAEQREDDDTCNETAQGNASKKTILGAKVDAVRTRVK